MPVILAKIHPLLLDKNLSKFSISLFSLIAMLSKSFPKSFSVIKFSLIILLVLTFRMFLLIFITLNKNESLGSKYSHFVEVLKLVSIKTVKVDKNDKSVGKNETLDSRPRNNHFIHWLTAFEIWKDKPLIGGGIKSFRWNCENYDHIDYFALEGRCNTHPHNIYLEILSETGIVGLILIILFFFRNLSNLNKVFLFSLDSFTKEHKSQLFISFLIIFILLIWPLKTSGRLFSNFYGTIFWFNCFSLIYILKNFNKKDT